MRKIPNQPIRAVWRWMRCLARRSFTPEQIEIKRLRRVLHDIAASRPDQHMDIEKNPELVNWICDTCHKASIGAYPSNAEVSGPPPVTPESKQSANGGFAAPIC